jgi:DNA topoisomerase-1
MVAEQLGNTPGVCCKYYFHPAITDAYLDGTLFEALEMCQKSRQTNSPLHLEERVVMHILRERAQKAVA